MLLVMCAVFMVEGDPAESEVDADNWCAVFWRGAIHENGVDHGVLCPFFHRQERPSGQGDLVRGDLENFLWKFVVPVVAWFEVEGAFGSE